MKKEKNGPENNEPKNHMFKTLLVAFGVFAVIFLLSHLISYIFSGQLMFRSPLNRDFILIQVLLSTLNSILLVYLLHNYIEIYHKIKSGFSIGLIMASIALLANSITSNPMLHNYFGFSEAGLGHFTIIPTIFTTAAAIILIDLSSK